MRRAGHRDEHGVRRLQLPAGAVQTELQMPSANILAGQGRVAQVVGFWQPPPIVGRADREASAQAGTSDGDAMALPARLSARLVEAMDADKRDMRAVLADQLAVPVKEGAHGGC